MMHSLRRRIQVFGTALVILTLLGSSLSLYRISEVGRSLASINRTSVPLSHLITQLKADTDLMRREMERSASKSHWNDPHWKPKPIPLWIMNIVYDEAERLVLLIRNSGDLNQPWKDWSHHLRDDLQRLKGDSEKIYAALEKHDLENAQSLYQQWQVGIEDWSRQLNWGSREIDQFLQTTFMQSSNRVLQLRTGLEVILIAVVLLSILMIWMAAKTLRPLNELTRLAREITERGLRKQHKSALPEIHTQRKDEVGQLAKEFQRMATALLEREKDIEMQKIRVQDQNNQLVEMGRLNKNILSSIRSVMIVVDMKGVITHCNPIALQWLGAVSEQIIGSEAAKWDKLCTFMDSIESAPMRINAFAHSGRIWGGRMNLLCDEKKQITGYVITLEDLTEETELQHRLHQAENLASMGRLSAQVAHEVRNPLHSIGLEAEMAVELAQKHGILPLKRSAQSILASVDRLEKITENYLKLSKLSSGEKKVFLLGDLLQSVLATYAAVCESQGVQVNWSIQQPETLVICGDQDLLEQVLGNMVKNSLQALEDSKTANPKIDFKLGSAETGGAWMRISDNGPGIGSEVRASLFTPFVTTKAHGTGLGLSFVKKVMEDHGGKIELSSIDSNDLQSSGACFDLIFPRPQLDPRKDTDFVADTISR